MLTPAVKRPASPIFYPESDGKPLAENTKQLQWIITLVGNLVVLFRDRPEEYSQWTGFALERALSHPDPAVSAPVRKALHGYTLQFEGKQRYDQSLVRDLAKTADQDAIGVLEDVYAKAKDPVSRWYALEALARLRPREALDLILDCVRREGVYDMLVDIVREQVQAIWSAAAS